MPASVTTFGPLGTHLDTVFYKQPGLPLPAPQLDSSPELKPAKVALGLAGVSWPVASMSLSPP